MEDLIEALGILKKYLKTSYNRKNPTICEHDVFMVVGINFKKMPLSEVRRLYELGFWLGTEWDPTPINMRDLDEKSTDEELQAALKFAKTNLEAVSSYRFGSC